MLLSESQDTLDTLSYAAFEHSLTEVIDKTTPYTSAYIVSAVLSFRQVYSFSSTSIGQITASLCIMAADALVYIQVICVKQGVQADCPSGHVCIRYVACMDAVLFAKVDTADSSLWQCWLHDVEHMSLYVTAWWYVYTELVACLAVHASECMHMLCTRITLKS